MDRGNLRAACRVRAGGGLYVINRTQGGVEQGTLADGHRQSREAADAGGCRDGIRRPGVQPFGCLEKPLWYESTVYSRVSGYIGDWKVDIGDRVEKGQLLCDIETPELDADLAAAEAKLKATQANVNVEESNMEFAKTTYDRWWHSPQGYVSEQEKQQKKAEYDSSVAKLAAAGAQVNLDQANLGRLKAMENFKRVTAPFAGVITSRRIDIGDLVTAGKHREHDAGLCRRAGGKNPHVCRRAAAERARHLRRHDRGGDIR